MSFAGVDLKRVALLSLLTLLVHEIYAQQQVSIDSDNAFKTSRIEPAGNLTDVVQKNALPVDTLQNYTVGDGTIFGWFADGMDQSGGWVHGTNLREDVAKATRITLPDGVSGAVLTEVLVTFIYKAPTVTTQMYSIQIREVASNGAPGDLLYDETYNMIDINADDDFSTDAFPTSHLFSEEVNVPREFFVVVNFGSYTSADYENVAIAASPNLLRFVEEEWELQRGNNWEILSDTWLSGDTTITNGWYMWIDAVVNTDIAFNDPNEPNDSASDATVIQDGFVSTGAAIFPLNDVDYYSFEGVGGAMIDVFTQAAVGSASEIDGIISIYSSSGALVAFNDDLNGSFTESQVRITLPVTDTYFIRYAAFDNDTGDDFPNKREPDYDEVGGILQTRLLEQISDSQRGVKVEKARKNTQRSAEVGAYTLRLTITGGGGDTDEPVIQHVPPTTVVPVGQGITLQAEITDAGSGVDSVFVAYLEGGRTSNDGIVAEMTLTSGNTYEVDIPATFVNERGLQYLIAAFDFANNVAFGNVVNLSTRFEDGFTQAIAASGTDANSYRLISMPLNLDDSSVRTVLEDDLGAYDPEVWRFWELLANQSYAEFPNVGALTPGKAYWLATSRSGQSITTGAGTTTSISLPIEVALNPGWTFVGTPFNFPINPDQVVLNSGAVPDIRTFNGVWSVLNGPMMPFQGYAVASVNNDRMFISPFAPVTTKQGKREALHTAEDHFEWALSISATSGALLDSDNLLAVSGSASGGWDSLDRPEPPVIGDYISLYFPHHDWDVPFSHFNTDVRPSFEESQQWDFEVSTSVEDPIEISFDGIERVPAEYDVYLVDRQMHNQQDLRVSPTYTVLAREQDLKERFAVVVGKPGMIEDELTNLTEIPERISVRSYPNPFQSHMTLEFGLPTATDVSLDIYDILGKRVARLVEVTQMDAGTHAIQWEGVDAAGRPLANGMYVFALQAGTSLITQKVVLLR